MKKYRAAEIFNGPCKGCHVDRGRARKGPDLFLNDCMMCHNVGKSATPLAQMRLKSREEIEKAIRQGVEKTAMPGWDVSHGGPLSDDEIMSLVDYIRPAARSGKGF